MINRNANLMNSDVESQTQSNIPRKINLINNLIWSCKLGEQLATLTESSSLDVAVRSGGGQSLLGLQPVLAD